MTQYLKSTRRPTADRDRFIKARTSIVSELLNGYGVNLVKPTQVVLALGCLVTILEFFDYSKHNTVVFKSEMAITKK